MRLDRQKKKAELTWIVNDHLLRACYEQPPSNFDEEMANAAIVGEDYRPIKNTQHCQCGVYLFFVKCSSVFSKLAAEK